MIYSSIFLFQIVITILFSVVAVISDLKKGIIPNKLNFSLIFFGLSTNLILSLLSNNIKYILASIISMFITYVVTYLLWKLNIWGGGDVKLFTGIATVIPFGINIDFLNIFPELSIYPFSFSVVINSILVSFPFLVIFLIHVVLRNELVKNNFDLLVNVFNIDSIRLLINSSMNKLISIKDLEEGMIVNDYYFNNEKISDLINDVDGNLKVYKSSDNDDFNYYFKSQSAGGITERDMYLLKIMNAQNIISDNISIKISFPFTPAILFGLMIAISYGDIMMLFAKNLFLVI